MFAKVQFVLQLDDALIKVISSRQVNFCRCRMYKCVYFLWEDANSNENKKAWKSAILDMICTSAST